MQQSLRADDGAAAVVVALCLVVLLGVGVLVVDAGGIFWERRQLQNGADSGALAVAQEYGKDSATGAITPSVGPLGSPYEGTAKEMADANAADGVSDVESLTLDPVDGVPLSRGGEITVTTLVNDDGVNRLSHWLASVLGEGEDFDSSVVRAAASAIYGPLGELSDAFPVVVCEHEYEDYGPGGGNEGDVFEIVLKRPPGQGGPVTTDCPTDPDTFPTGQTPGNFSWLTPSGDDCQVDFSLDEGETTDDGDGDTGVNVPQGCGGEARSIADGIDDYANGVADSLPIRHIAVFSAVDGTGENTVYTITRLAAFEFHGIKTVAPGGPNPSAVIGGWSADCQGSGTDCLKGRFTGDTSTGEIDFDADSDVLGVQLTR